MLDTVIVTAATFAPDGKSLLCAVFGESGIWTMDSFAETTLYQVRIDDFSFDSVRIFKTDVPATPTYVSWLKDNSVLIHSWDGPPPHYPVLLVKPAAFERFESPGATANTQTNNSNGITE